MNKQYNAGSEPISVSQQWYEIKMKNVLIYKDWLLHTETSGRWCIFIGSDSVYFEFEDDVVMFKLRWM